MSTGHHVEDLKLWVIETRMAWVRLDAKLEGVRLKLPAFKDVEESIDWGRTVAVDVVAVDGEAGNRGRTLWICDGRRVRLDVHC